jgi:hypothetical protein
MSDKVIKMNDLLFWAQQNSFLCEEQPPPSSDFEVFSPLPSPLSQWRMTQDFNLNPQWYPAVGGHDGIDWGIAVGTPILGAITGTVTVSGYRPDRPDYDPYGDHVRISTMATDHNGIEREYVAIHAHLSRLDVAVGDKVQAGQQVGLSGGVGSRAGNSSGPHLHFGIICKGSKGRGETFLNGDFMNPRLWINKYLNQPNLSTNVLDEYRVKAGIALNVRNKAGLSDSIVRFAMNELTRFNVYETVSVSGNPWGTQDISRTAWNSLYRDYVEKV